MFRILIGLVLPLIGVLPGCRSSTDPDPEPKPAPSQEVKEPVKVLRFEVLHWADLGAEADFRATMGSKLPPHHPDDHYASFNDYVKIKVEFARAAHAYLLAYNANGTEQLLWPVNDEKQPDKNVIPPAETKLVYPVREKKAFYLNDEPTGGLQAFAVVASREPLPAFAQWKKGRGEASWKKLPPGRGVWRCDGEGVYPLPRERGRVESLRNAPPLESLYTSLKKGPAEVVELIAFGVRAKEGE
jgi:hypothetical protein